MYGERFDLTAKVNCNFGGIESIARVVSTFQAICYSPNNVYPGLSSFSMMTSSTIVSIPENDEDIFFFFYDTFSLLSM